MLKTLESPLDCKEIKPVYPRGNQSWIFIGKADAEAEAPILWSPDAMNWLIGKDLDSGRIKKVGGEGDDIGWSCWMASLTRWTWVSANSGCWGWTGSLVCCSPWVHKKSDMTEWLNWTDEYLSIRRNITRLYVLSDIHYY